MPILQTNVGRLPAVPPAQPRRSRPTVSRIGIAAAARHVIAIARRCIVIIAVPNGPNESSHFRNDRQPEPDPNEAGDVRDEGAPPLPLGVDGTGGRPYRRLPAAVATASMMMICAGICGALAGILRMIGAATAAAGLGGGHPPRPSASPGGRGPRRGAGG